MGEKQDGETKSQEELDTAKAEEEKKAAEEKKGDEETPEQKAEREAKEAEAVKEKEKRSFENMQERIDEITKEKAELRKEIEEIRAKLPKDNKEPEYTEKDLYAILADPAQSQYHPFAIKELINLGIKGYDTKLKANLQVSDAVRASADKALKEFPDLENEDSKLWKLADKIFRDESLKSNPNGTYLAAKLANDILEKGDGETKEQLQRKLDKLNKKTSLAGGGAKPAGANPNAAYEKIKKEGLIAGPNTPAWDKWQKEIIARSKIKK
jgi:hypothetical protein